jgi:hypothetical protein
MRIKIGGAWRRGEISDGQYWGSVALGAATGILSSFGGGILSGALFGGGASFANNIGNQAITNDPCDNTDWTEATAAGVLGAGSGLIAGFGTALGSNIVTVPKPAYIGDVLTNHGTVGGIFGNAIGSGITY